jgi:beta-lactamase regulating signal transducer with metallopeptidase domain
MIDFLIKSSISLFVLLAVYHLLLEKEKMHVFNRFYLLFSLAFSMVIPFITIEVIEEISKPIAENSTIQIMEGTAILVQETNYLPIVLGGIYGLVTLFLTIRFIGNIQEIVSKIKSNNRIDYKNSELILLKEKTLPHTFLDKIFINETDFNNRNIEEELYTHELVHVTQKHTLDILFIEILKTIFWFNPIFILYKKTIQLNHEFLADEKVVKSYNNVPFYQSLLLSKANENQPFYLASNLNYLVTKKRLIMMTKTTSKTKSILKKIILIPFIFGLVFFLCFKTVAQEKTTTPVANKPTKEQTNDERRDAYYSGVRVIIHDLTKNTKIDKKYEDLTLDEKRKCLFYVPNAFQKKSPTEKELEGFKDSKKYAVWVDGVHKQNDYLNNFKPIDIAFFQGSSVSKNARSKKFPQPFQYNFYTHNYFDKNLKNSHKKFSGEKLEITLSNNKNVKPIRTSKDKESVTSLTEIKNSDIVSEITQPEFQGGMNEFYKFVGANYKIPAELKGNGRVYIKFMVEKDGSLSEFEILRDIGFGTGEEAIRVLKLSPKWIPGKDKNQPVRVQYNLPITLQAK